MTVEFGTALLCDQIRQEMNGKYLVIGLYSSNVVFSAFPATGHFHLLSRAHLRQPGEHKISIRVNVGGVENHRFDAEFAVEQPSEDWIPIPLQPVQFQVPGLFSVDQLGPDGKWTEFFQINVIRPPIASPQPS